MREFFVSKLDVIFVETRNIYQIKRSCLTSFQFVPTYTLKLQVLYLDDDVDSIWSGAENSIFMLFLFFLKYRKKWAKVRIFFRFNNNKVIPCNPWSLIDTIFFTSSICWLKIAS